MAKDRSSYTKPDDDFRDKLDEVGDIFGPGAAKKANRGRKRQKRTREDKAFWDVYKK